MERIVTYNPKKDKFVSFKFDKTNFLFNVCFMLTKRCNFKCIHCSQDNFKPEISLKVYKKFIDKLKKGG